MSPPIKPIKPRLMASIKMDGTCWIWHGSATKDGYGVIGIRRKQARALGSNYEYLGKCLNLCSPRRLIDCILSMRREITYLRAHRDEYLDRAIAAEARCERLLAAMGRDCARAYREEHGEAV